MQVESCRYAFVSSSSYPARMDHILAEGIFWLNMALVLIEINEYLGGIGSFLRGHLYTTLWERRGLYAFLQGYS